MYSLDRSIDWLVDWSIDSDFLTFWLFSPSKIRLYKQKFENTRNFVAYVCFLCDSYIDGQPTENVLETMVAEGWLEVKKTGVRPE